MKKGKLDINMPIGKLARAKDMLPSPEELIIPERTVKVTLRLSEDSIKFFKRYAQKYHMKYQKMIRKVVDAYTERFTASQ
ncbi:MAG: CopG family transcriptional regulator [Candidatus Omnitrophota bacterium]